MRGWKSIRSQGLYAGTLGKFEMSSLIRPSRLTASTALNFRRQVVLLLFVEMPALGTKSTTVPLQYGTASPTCFPT